MITKDYKRLQRGECGRSGLHNLNLCLGGSSCVPAVLATIRNSGILCSSDLWHSLWCSTYYTRWGSIVNRVNEKQNPIYIYCVNELGNGGERCKCNLTSRVL